MGNVRMCAMKYFLTYTYVLSIILFFSTFMLTSCASEKSFRGVSETTWEQLTSEQKKIIVNHTSQNERINSNNTVKQ